MGLLWSLISKLHNCNLRDLDCARAPTFQYFGLLVKSTCSYCGDFEDRHENFLTMEATVTRCMSEPVSINTHLSEYLGKLGCKKCSRQGGLQLAFTHLPRYLAVEVFYPSPWSTPDALIDRLADSLNLGSECFKLIGVICRNSSNTVSFVLRPGGWRMQRDAKEIMLCTLDCVISFMKSQHYSPEILFFERTPFLPSVTRSALQRRLPPACTTVATPQFKQEPTAYSAGILDTQRPVEAVSAEPLRIPTAGLEQHTECTTPSQQFTELVEPPLARAHTVAITRRTPGPIRRSTCGREQVARDHFGSNGLTSSSTHRQVGAVRFCEDRRAPRALCIGRRYADLVGGACVLALLVLMLHLIVGAGRDMIGRLW